MKLRLFLIGVTTDSQFSTKMRNVLYDGRRGFYFRDIWIGKILKIHIIIFRFADRSVDNKADTLKIQWILKNYRLIVGTE